MSMDIDLYEKEILEDYESGTLKSSGISAHDKKRLSEIAANTLMKRRENGLYDKHVEEFE